MTSPESKDFFPTHRSLILLTLGGLCQIFDITGNWPNDIMPFLLTPSNSPGLSVAKSVIATNLLAAQTRFFDRLFSYKSPTPEVDLRDWFNLIAVFVPSFLGIAAGLYFKEEPFVQQIIFSFPWFVAGSNVLFKFLGKIK